jgi:broad specificity phosphatase PhoE
MSEFYLIRHGQASFGAQNYDKLSPLGQQQALWLGEYLGQRKLQFDVVISGDMVRHRETAEGICCGLGQSVPEIIDIGLNEFDFNNIAQAYLSVNPDQQLANDAKREDFYRLLKKAMLAWSAGQLPEQDLFESWFDFRERVKTVLEQICLRHYGKRILVVSSGGAISMLLSLILDLDAKRLINLNMQVKNASFSHFYFNQHSVRLSSFNNVPHLDQPERIGAVTFS